MIDTQYLTDTCAYIKEIFNHFRPIVWSWGALKFYNIEYKDMPAVRFTVNGFIHKGDVIVALNAGTDAFEIYCLNSKDEVVNSVTEIYVDELVDVIDRMVEKAGTQAEYNAKIANWGALL